MIKKCLNTENTIDNRMFFLNIEFCANGISLRVKTGISLLDWKTFFDGPWGYKPPQRKPIPHSKKVPRKI